MNTRMRSLVGLGLLCWLGISCPVYATSSGGSAPPPSPPAPGSPDCSAGTNYAPYGWANPGDPDPKYSLGYPDPNAQDLVGFVAKGNIVIGDPSDPDFQSDVLPKLQAPSTRPYAVDQSDAALGYVNAGAAACSGAPSCFDGNYNQNDGGTRTDSSPRKFYEPTLTDAQLKANWTIVNPHLSKTNSGQYSDTFDGVYYTDHGFIGKLGPRYVNFNGSVVARDDAFVYNENLQINHDVRLLNPKSAKIGLPNDIWRPILVQWQECPASRCPDP